MPLGEAVQRFAVNEFLRDLALERDAVGTVLGHGFHPVKARQPRSNQNTRSVHPQGCTPNLRVGEGHISAVKEPILAVDWLDARMHPHDPT